jgi:hypothetical protein
MDVRYFLGKKNFDFTVGGENAKACRYGQFQG